jgi:peptidoglycan/LPS O-acetylase OafA/YrhL
MKVYFPNLNGFRFIAAMMVIVCHLELFKARIGKANFWKHPLISESGSAGVDFFFVLSGFLITTLLLVELGKTGTISLRKFYIRRVLRIWPLYFLVVAIGFFLVPYISIFNIPGYSERLFDNFWPKLILTIGLMPNAALAFWGEIPYAAPLWSVGVEEQFYLIWPLLLFLPRKLTTILLFIAFFIGIKVLLVLLGASTEWKNFVVATRMECMGIGGLGAYLYHRYKLKVSNVMTILSVGGVFLVLLNAYRLFELHHILLSLFFLLIIMNGATNEKSFIRFENPVLHTLGTISYGLYLWHPFCIGVALWLTGGEGAQYYLVAIVITIGVSYVSYFYFEKMFLDMKERFSVIISGNAARKGSAANPAKELDHV